MNEDVLNMIYTLHARLDDVKEAVEALPNEAPEYAKRLDKVDDSLYLIQVELEKLAASTDAVEASENSGSSDSEGETASASSTETDDAEAAPKASADDAEAAKQGEKKEILTEEMKDNLADAGRAIGNVLRDSKDVVSELSGTMNDLKDVFSFGKKR